MMFESLEGRALLAGVQIDPTSWQGANFVNNEVMVRFNSSITKDQAASELFMKQGATIKQWWPELNLAEVRWPLAFTNSDGQIGAIQSIHNWTSVYYAEPNFIRGLERTPNDPGFQQKWDLNNTGQVVNPPPQPVGVGLPPGTPGDDIDAVRAWDLTTGNPNTIIAIIDTGVDYNHPDLFNNMWRNPGELPDGIDNDGNGYIDDIFGWDFADGDNDPDDTDGHGTHVAGIADAVGNNNIGVVGVSWNSTILPIRAGNPAFSTSAIAGSQLYIAKMRSQYGFNIVSSNNSYGGIGPFSFAEFDAIRTAINAGIVFVSSAGNATNNNDAMHHYPSDYNLNGVIAVASSDNNDQLSTFSNYGITGVDLVAPGEQILSTVPPFYNPPLLYDYFDGTSMASPHVAGAVALLKSFDPSLSVDQVKSLLLQGTDKYLALTTKVLSAGRLNVANSLDLVPQNEIQGSVFEDANASLSRDVGENGLAGWTVYIDRNGNGVFDTGEPSTLTLADGSYRIRGIFGPGSVTIREIVKPTFTQTLPTNNGSYTVNLATKTSVVSNITFGVQQVPGEIHGRKWNDLNGDGVMDPTEPGIQGVVVYVDLNNDAKIGIGEPAAVTDRNGNYTIIKVQPGTYVVREVYQPGFIQIFPDPTTADLGANTGVIVTRGTITPGINFGNKAAFDYGDAPNPYPTLIAKNGAVHGILQGFLLGARVDAEVNGLPTVGANGDDTSNLDDEDGVAISNLTNNSVQTVAVTASTGAFAAGYLQGWIDFNKDGDWNDAGEQIFKDVQLTTGTFNLSFTVPNIADNLLGPTYARFRYSLEHGIKPTGPALGGEVEDYVVNILGPSPTALDDSYTVDDNSLFFQNPLHVLDNDLPSTSGAPGLWAGGLNTSGTLGQVQVNDNGTPADPTDDFYEYQPPASYVGLDSFKYSVKDPVGNVSTEATVTINVQFVARDPIAVDNTFDVLINSLAAANKLDVMANDVQGTGGAVKFSTQTPPTTANGGTVTIDDNGTATNFSDDFYRYAPPAAFTGQDSFDYTIVDALNKTSTGHVTIQVVPAPRTPFSDAILQFELRVLKNGVPLGLSEVLNVGDHIQVQGIASDIRPPGSAFDPSQNIDFTGVFSAYMDLLFDKGHFQTFGPIQFSTLYGTNRSGIGGTPGLIDEIGATYSGGAASPGTPQRIFTREFVATATGTNFVFTADPADDLPNHDMTAFVVDADPLQSKVQAIPSDQVYYLASQPIVEIIGSGEGESTNLFNPIDVNLDGKISPIDALLVINWLNQPSSSGGSGEGEPASGWKRDVNHDNAISPIDALMVINYLNRPKPVTPAGEAEGEADVASSLSPLVLSNSNPSGSNVSTDSDADVPVQASQVDQVFAQTDWTKPTVNRSEDYVAPSTTTSSDEYFTNLGTAVRRNRKS
jgi:subtilisin family serine protease